MPPSQPTSIDSGLAPAPARGNKVVPDVSSRTLSELISLSGRVAVVTGGARGIGLAIVRRLAEAGAAVAIADLDKQAAEEAARNIRKVPGAQCMGIEVDVADADSVRDAADKAVNAFGAPHIWVNNAGVYPITPLLDLSESQWDRVVNVNLKGSFLGAQEAAKRMIAAGIGGVIINLASVAGYRAAGIGGTEYVAAKHGVRGLTKSLAAQLGRHGIRVLALAPGTIDTPGIAKSREEVRAMGVVQVDADHELPLGRDGVPDDVARVVLFCASDLSMLMTGSTLPVDGGMLVLL